MYVRDTRSVLTWLAITSHNFMLSLYRAVSHQEMTMFSHYLSIAPDDSSTLFISAQNTTINIVARKLLISLAVKSDNGITISLEPA